MLLFSQNHTGFGLESQGERDILKIHAAEFAEDLQFDRDVSVTLRPGYPCAYPSDPSGMTTNRASVTISEGPLQWMQVV